LPLDLVPPTAAGLASRGGLRDGKKMRFIVVLPLRYCECIEVFWTKGTGEAVGHGGVDLIGTRRFEHLKEPGYQSGHVEMT
jgi:hypothetical protein